MKEEIVGIDICSELDIVLAHKYIVELCDLAGVGIGDQTRLATAISEVARNILEYAGESKLCYSILQKDGKTYVEACLSDKGPGIPEDEMTEIMAGKHSSHQNHKR